MASMISVLVGGVKTDLTMNVELAVEGLVVDAAAGASAKIGAARRSAWRAKVRRNIVQKIESRKWIEVSTQIQILRALKT
mmetsp:Transcript_96695/g.177781  ORF Transcript_96695/g.177781 Transcript_96695/m.177781 type:complete len:80 (-) Transcript_96695:7-246(-)